MTTRDEALRKAGWWLGQAGDDVEAGVTDPEPYNKAGFWLREAGDATPPNVTDTLIRPTLEHLNATIYDMYRNYNGGYIRVDGMNEDLAYDGPIIKLPHVIIEGVGFPNMYSATRTRIAPAHSGPIFTVDDGAVYGTGREAWGGSGIRNFQVVPTGDKKNTVLNIIGGNGSEFHNIMAQHKSGKSFEYGVLIDEGRGYDGQYSTFSRIRLPRVFYGFHALRGAPDCVTRESLFYGDDRIGSEGLYLQYGAGGTSDRASNLEFLNCHFQFYDKGHTLMTPGVTLRDGSWENHSSGVADDSLSYATYVGTKADDLVIDAVSYENLDSVREAFVFESGADIYPIRFTGHTDKVYAKTDPSKHYLFESTVTT